MEELGIKYGEQGSFFSSYTSGNPDVHKIYLNLQEGCHKVLDHSKFFESPESLSNNSTFSLADCLSYVNIRLVKSKVSSVFIG